MRGRILSFAIVLAVASGPAYGALPDLTVAAVSGPTTAQAGAVIAVSDTVTVTDASVGTFSVGFYLSADATISTDDRRIGTRQVAGGLAAGASSSATTQVALPAGLSGAFYVGAIVDYGSRIVESDETNNGLAGNVIQIAPPDLTVTAVSGPTSAQAGATIAVSDTVTVTGGSVGTFSVGIYLSADATISTDDRRIGTRQVAGGLAAGASSSATTQATLPAGLSGAFYVGAIVDYGGKIIESDETNNALAGNIIQIAPPDLTVTAVSGPTSAQAGATIAVSDTVTVTGGSVGTFSVGFYLSDDATISTDDRRIGTRQVVGGLASGASSSATTQATLPAGVSGTFYLGAIVDYGGKIIESDETNNTLAGNVIQIAPPDLTVAAVSGPGNAQSGATIAVSDTVTVTGGSVGTFSVGFYLSTDPAITTGDRRIGTRQVAGGLASGASSSATTQATLPAGLSGTFYLGAIVDYGGKIIESDETNNTLAGNVIQIAPPDLTVTAIGGPSAVAPGATIAISDTVTVTGGSVGTFSVGFYLSADATITTGDRRIGTRQVAGGLASGASSSATTQVTLPARLSGTFYLGAIVDYGGKIIESDETNNALAGNVIQIQPADIAMTSVNGGPVAVTGQTYSIQYAVSNAGTPPVGGFLICFYLSSGGLLNSDNQVAVAPVSALASGETISGTVTGQVPILPNGTYQLIAVADCQNEVVESSEVNNTLDGNSVVVGTDSLPPTLVIQSPADGLLTNVSTVALTVEATDDFAVQSVTANGAPLSLGGDGLWRGTLPLTEGSNAIEVIASDFASHVTSRSLTVRRDSTPPTLVVYSPMDGLTVYSSSVNVVGQVTEASGITLTINGLPVVVNGDGTFAENVPLQAGDNAINIVATDEAGNSAVSTRTVKRLSNPPSVVVSDPPQGFVTASTTVLVRGTTSGGAPPLSLIVNGMATPVAADGTFTGTASFDIGAARVVVRITDHAGVTAEQVVVGQRTSTTGGGGTPTCSGTLFAYDAIGNLTGAFNVCADAANCGVVGHLCPGAANASGICINGACLLSSGGQIIDTSLDIANCGQINYGCTGIPNGSPTCEGGVCGVQCADGYVPGAGQCVDVMNDSANCGFVENDCEANLGGAAVCRFGECASLGTPIVTSLNGIAVPGEQFRAPLWAGIQIVGINLDRITTIDFEDWGADTVDGEPGGAKSIPMPMDFGFQVGPDRYGRTPYEQRPTQISITKNGLDSFAASYDFGWRDWYKLRLNYDDNGIDASILVDVAFSIDDLAPVDLPPPQIASVDAVRVLWSYYSPYDPLTGFIETCSPGMQDCTDPTQLTHPPTAILGYDHIPTEYPVLAVTHWGIYIAKGLPVAEITPWLNSEALMMSLVIPIDEVQDEVIRVGASESWPYWLGSGVILRGSNLYDDGPLVLSNPVGTIQQGDLSSAMFLGDRVVLRSISYDGGAVAYVEFDSNRGTTTTARPLIAGPIEVGGSGSSAYAGPFGNGSYVMGASHSQSSGESGGGSGDGWDGKTWTLDPPPPAGCSGDLTNSFCIP